MRLHFYVDGELAAAQCGTGMVYDLPVGRGAPGSQTITVRVSDALGRWADTSIQLDLPLSESALALLDAAPGPPTGDGTTWRIRSLVERLWH